MGVISTTVLILGGIGVIAAVVLYFVAKKFHVYENPKIAEIEELLPGANCGGCGMSGCHAFAKACAETDSLDGFNCTGAGKDIMEKISVIVGLEAKAGVRRVAVMKCHGGCEERQVVNNYDGVDSCAMEGTLYQGETDCNYGCLGRGDCVASCIFDALHIDHESGIAVVDIDKCTGCGKCVKTCPRHLLELVPVEPDKPIVWVACMNHDKGALAMKECTLSCIGCGKCKRVCNHDAVTVDDFVAHINPEKCVGCGECEGACPRSSIHHIGDLRPELKGNPETSDNKPAGSNEA